jgi:hypothetical protein
MLGSFKEKSADRLKTPIGNCLLTVEMSRSKTSNTRDSVVCLSPGKPAPRQATGAG